MPKNAANVPIFGFNFVPRAIETEIDVFSEILLAVMPSTIVDTVGIPVAPSNRFSRLGTDSSGLRPSMVLSILRKGDDRGKSSRKP